MSASRAVPRMRFAPVLFGTILTGALIWLVVQASNVFLLLFLAVLLSLFLRAVADVFESRLRLPSAIALLFAVLISLGALAGLITLLVPPFAEQTRALSQELPKYITGLENQLAKLGERIPPLKQYLATGDHKAVTVLYEQASAQLEGLLPKVFGLLHLAIDGFALMVMALYLARLLEFLIRLIAQPLLVSNRRRDLLLRFGQLRAHVEDRLLEQLLRLFSLRDQVVQIRFDQR